MKIKKILDLSHPIYHNCPGYIPYEMAEVKYEKIYPRDGFTAERINLNSHTATHLDAPFHFSPDGVTIDQMPLDLFCGEAVPINLFGIKAHTSIGVEHLKTYDALINEGDIVLLCTGWCRKRGVNNDYCNEWPFLSYEGSEWLLRKGVKGIAIDSISVGGPYEGESAPQHHLLLGNGIWLLEELNVPDELLEHEKWYLFTFPLNLKGFGGSPTRTVAMLLE